MIELRRQLSEIRTGGHLGPGASERDQLVRLIDYGHRAPAPWLSTDARLVLDDPAAGAAFQELTTHYNTLLMGVPEVFIGFHAGGNSDVYAPLVGLEPEQMKAWVAAMRPRATPPERLREDLRGAQEWLSYWHPGLGLEDHPMIVPVEHRARVRALGQCVSKIGRSVYTVRRFMNDYEVLGVVGATPARLVARDSETWLARLLALAGAWRFQEDAPRA